MEDFELTAFLKALLFMQVAVHLHAISNGIFFTVFLPEVLNLTKHKPMAQSESQ